MKTITFRAKQQYSTVRQQLGSILIMFTVGLFSLLAVAALALDGSHLLLNKSRLQNVVDSSALNAAKMLQDGGTLLDARQVAIDIIQQNLAFNQNNELEQGVDLASPDYNNTQVTSNIVIEFSALPSPFIPILVEGSEYVRVRVENVDLNNFLADIMGFNKVVRSSAVAGRSTDITCNTKLIPMMVCAEEILEDGIVVGHKAPDKDLLYVMKTSSAANPEPDLGPGNFQLLDLGVSPSDTTLKEAMAGGYGSDVCVELGDTVDTKPGNNVGPVAAGLNMRLGVKTPGQANLDEDLYPPDYNTCQGEPVALDENDNIINPDTLDAYRFTSYDLSLADPVSNNCSVGNIDVTTTSGRAGGRREMEVVIGICDGKTNGANTVTVVDKGCFFLTQEVTQKGNEAYVIGEYSSTCSGAGNASLEPTFESDSSTIVLYRDPDSPDS